MPRRFPIFQFPNPPLIVAGLGRVVARLGQGRAAGGRGGVGPPALLVSRLALLVWALEEITDGANWFRRLLGLGGGCYALTRLLPPASSRGGRASGP